MTTIDRGPVTKGIAERIQALAAERGVSNDTLVAAFDLPAGEAQRILDGTQEIYVSELLRIVTLLGVSFRAILEGTGGEL